MILTARELSSAKTVELWPSCGKRALQRGKRTCERTLAVQRLSWGKTIEIYRHGRLHLVRSASDALDVLFSDWPMTEGRAYFSALEACAKTEWGEATHYDARYAFILALVEAGIYFEVH